MSMFDIIMKMPWPYWTVLILFSLLYAYRGLIEQKYIIENGQGYRMNSWQQFFYFYIQEFLFKVLITASAFIALFVANYIFSSLKSLNDIGAGTAVLLIFLIMWGVIGVSGYLTWLIVSGKFPGFK